MGTKSNGITASRHHGITASRHHTLLLFFLLIPLFSISQSSYYYYKGEKVFLNLDITYLHISTANNFQSSSIDNLDFTPFSLKLENELVNNEIPKWAKIEFQTEPTNTEYYQKINSLRSNNNIITVSPNFTSTNGEEIGMSSFFYVKIKQASDYNLLLQQANAKNVLIIGQNQFMPLWYTLRCTKNTIGNTLDIANYFYETDLFLESVPDFLTNDLLCSNDTNFSQLWGLQNSSNPNADINICEAWNLTEGSGVMVAVLDQGIELTHQDLYSNIASISYDTESNSSPSQIFGNHGTHVSGTIGAIKDNNLQVVGVAPQSTLMSISNSLLATPNSRIKRADGINWAWQNGADIINNSWKSGVQYQVIDDAIENALTNGRNGLGTIVIFSAGNTGNTGINSVNYPANSNPDILTVGASNITENRYGFSSYGEKLDVGAPGENILSTILNNGVDYKNGTSMAAPHVAGVAALILSVNPCLNGEQVRDIIESTAQKSAPHIYLNNPDRPNGTWGPQLGYGIVDAYAAVQLAQELYSPTLDFLVKDSLQDLGIEPDDVTEYMWRSTDIWVRNQADGIEEHQNPEYDANNPNYVYVRVTNKSCEASTGSNDELKLYWAKANTSLDWDEYWTGQISINGVSMGGEVTTLNIPALSPGEEAIIQFEWHVPNPEDYQGINPNPWHFCLLARVESINDPMTFQEISSINTNVKENNNIAWKNTTVVDIIPETPSLIGGVVAVGNSFGTAQTFTLELVREQNEAGKAIYKEAEVTLEMDDVLYNAWQAGGEVGINYRATTIVNKKIVTNDNLLLENIQFGPNEIGTLYLTFNFLTKELTNKAEYIYHVIQRDAATNEIIGGETFEIRKQPRDIFTADAGDDAEVGKNEPITISAAQINEAAVYNWYDSEGNLIYTGTDLTVTPDVTKTYKLEIIADIDGFKDFDEIKIIVNPFSLESLFPNPASNQVTINYNAEDASSAYLMVIGTINGVSNNYILDTTQIETVIDITSYPFGFYTVALVCDGEIVEAKTLLKD